MFLYFLLLKDLLFMLVVPCWGVFLSSLLPDILLYDEITTGLWYLLRQEKWLNNGEVWHFFSTKDYLFWWLPLNCPNNDSSNTLIWNLKKIINIQQDIVNTFWLFLGTKTIIFRNLKTPVYYFYNFDQSQNFMTTRFLLKMVRSLTNKQLRHQYWVPFQLLQKIETYTLNN